MITKYTLIASGLLCGGLALSVGVQSWRLSNCQSAHSLTQQTLEKVRGDRDQAVRVSNENAAATTLLAGDLMACVASKMADVARAQESAAAAIRDRAAMLDELARERALREEVYANDPESALWRDAPVPNGIEQRLRDSRAASRNES